MSSNNNNNGEKDVSLVQQNNNDTASPSTSSPNATNNSNDDEEVITQLTLAGLKVLMVRKRDQIIYKLPDNMQVAAIGDEQRQQLMKEIQSLHAATMAAAANAQQQQQQQQQQKPNDIKPIAPRNESLNPLDTPPKPTAAEADAIKETARKLREELEQQQQLQMLQQSQKPGNAATFDPNDSKSSTRKYNKTGKYSKKRQQQLQQQLYQQLQQQYPQQQQLTQQQLLALQQSLQQQTTINTGYDNRSSSTTPMTGNTTATSTPLSSAPNSSFPFPLIAQQQAQQAQQQDGSAKSSPVPPTPPPVPIQQQIQQKTLPPADSILSKRLPEEELQHREVKKRCVESLLADHQSVTFPDYEKPFASIRDAMKRLMPYHIYQYPKGDLDANKIPLERQDHTMIEIFKCQSDLFEKHGNISKKIEKNEGKLSLQIMMERQVLAEQRQKLTEEQNRVQAEQAAQHQELMRLQTEKARIEQEAKQQQQQIQPQPQTPAQLQPQQQLQQILQQILPPQALEQLQQQQQQQPNSAAAAANYANGLAQATALLQNPQFVNQYSQLSPDLQAKLLRNREQLVALIEKQQAPSNPNNNSSQQP